MKRTISSLTKLLVFTVFFISSCTVQKRKYTQGFYTHWHITQQKQEPGLLKQKTNHTCQTPVVSNAIQKTKESENVMFETSLNVKPELSFDSKSKINSAFFSGDSCDIIVLKSGIRIKAKVKEITGETIKYKKCDFEEGPLYIQSKKDAAAIEYANGRKEAVQYSAAQKGINQNSGAEGIEREKKTEALGIVGLFMSSIGLFVAGILFGLTGIVFGITSLRKIDAQPEKYRNKKGFAYWSIGLGIVAVIGALLVLFLL